MPAPVPWAFLNVVVQRPPTALEPGPAHTRSSLLQPAATPHGGLNPADAPLVDAEILFRQPGQPLSCAARNLLWNAYQSLSRPI